MLADWNTLGEKQGLKRHLDVGIAAEQHDILSTSIFLRNRVSCLRNDV